ncbi:Clavaminate synthase-like protein [Xylaria intraflava]|nr:Clavaminate synthase-like protein [Xylaria intraflava]
MRWIASRGGYQVFESITGHLLRNLGRCAKPTACQSYHSSSDVRPAATTDGNIDLDSFRSLAWESAIPVHLRAFHCLPAMKSWFTAHPETSAVSFGHKLEAHAHTPLSYELTIASDGGTPSEAYASTRRQDLHHFQTWLERHPDDQQSRLLRGLISHLLESVEDGRSHFLQFEAPLCLILRAYQYNRSRDDPSSRIRQLYIAQHDIRDLPAPLGEDLPTPEIVDQVGKGDLYNSSIWLGLQPTYTPLHRDPNPNLFCQVFGSKAVRLVPPNAGLSVFQRVRRELGPAGNSRFRGPEMMEGLERARLHQAIWDRHDVEGDIWEAVLQPGDALFIPQGWWHSVVSIGHEAELNASANWWFR